VEEDKVLEARKKDWRLKNGGNPIEEVKKTIHFIRENRER